jgi:hypothetical protein
MKKKWCAFHQQMEPVSNFYKNIFKVDGLADQCKDVSNYYTDVYYENNKQAISKKSAIDQKWRYGKISREQKVKMFTEINNKYGITTRVK